MGLYSQSVVVHLVQSTVGWAVELFSHYILLDSKDKTQLGDNKITHIVSAHDNAKSLLQVHPSELWHKFKN